jgi:hypothetical protein
MRPQHDSVQPAGVGRHRVPQRARLEEGGCVVHRAEHRGRRQILRDLTSNIDLSAAVRALHVQLDALAAVGHLKFRSVMLAGKKATAGELVDPRVRVSPRNVNTLASRPVVLPDNGYPVGRVFTGEAEEPRRGLRPDVFQPDEADAGDRVPAVELWPQGCRQMPLDHGGVDPEVDEQPPPYEPVDCGKSHLLPPF